MATKTPPVTAKTPPTVAASYTISQQALNVVRQLVNAKGWPDTLVESYDGGKLVSKYLPPLDDLSWVKNDVQLRSLTPEALAAYQQRDKEWSEKQITVSLTDKQVGYIRKAFLFFVAELVKNKQLGVNLVFNEVIDVFGVPLEDVAKAETKA